MLTNFFKLGNFLTNATLPNAFKKIYLKTRQFVVKWLMMAHLTADAKRVNFDTELHSWIGQLKKIKH